MLLKPSPKVSACVIQVHPSLPLENSISEVETKELESIHRQLRNRKRINSCSYAVHSEGLGLCQDPQCERVKVNKSHRTPTALFAFAPSLRAFRSSDDGEVSGISSKPRPYPSGAFAQARHLVPFHGVFREPEMVHNKDVLLTQPSHTFPHPCQTDCTERGSGGLDHL